MARPAVLTRTTISPVISPARIPRERGTNENNNGLMEMLPEKWKRKFPAATRNIHGWPQIRFITGPLVQSS